MPNIHFFLDITLTQGDDRDIILVFKDGADDPYDIGDHGAAGVNEAQGANAHVFRYTAKKDVFDTDDANALIFLDSDDGVEDDMTFSQSADAVGFQEDVLTIHLPAAATQNLTPGTYNHDLKVNKPADGVTETWMKGKLIVERAVTQRTTTQPTP